MLLLANNKIIKKTIVAFFVFVTFFSVIPTTQIFALNNKDADPITNAKSYMYYQAMQVCIYNAKVNVQGATGTDVGQLTESNANDGKWFSNSGISTNPKIGYFASAYGNSTDGDQVGCGGDDTDWILDAVKLWGYENPAQALCQFGMGRVSGQDCYTGSGNLAIRDEANALSRKLSIEEFRKNISTNVYDGASPSLSKAGEYEMYHNVFFTGCLGDINKAPQADAPDDDFTYNISIYDLAAKKVTTNKYYGVKKKSEKINYGEELITGQTNNTNPFQKTQPKAATCEFLASKLNSETAGAYAAYDAANPGVIEKKKNEDKTSTNSNTSCAIATIGWIICPVVNFLAGIVDSAYGQVEKMLITEPINITNQNDPVYKTWSTMRSIANVGFVIAFLFIIFSQITSFGIDNYGIKKMLPKLIIAAVLVNLSYLICAIAVDISNIVGNSIGLLIDGVETNISAVTFKTNDWSTATGWGGLVAIILAGGGLAIGVIYGALAVLIPALITAVFIIAAVFLALTLRQALLILMIAISPLAFVALVLPNTEDLFEKWKKLAMALLLMYPIISIVFSASRLASTIIMKSSGDTIIQIMGALMTILPLVIIPALIIKALDAFGNIGSKINGMSSKVGTASSKKMVGAYDKSHLGQYTKYRENERTKRDSLIAGGAYTGKNPYHRLKNSSSKWINDHSGSFGDRNAAIGLAAGEKIEKEQVETARVLIAKQRSMANSDAEALNMSKNTFKAAIKSGDNIKSKAAFSDLYNLGSGGIEAIREVISKELIPKDASGKTITFDTTDANGKTIKNIAKNDTAKALSSYIATEYSAIENKDARIFNFATQSTVDPGLTANSDHLSGLTNAQIASQTPSSIKSSNISPQKALEILNDPNIKQNIKDKQVAELKAKAGMGNNTTQPNNLTTTYQRPQGNNNQNP